jgi:perosamine synthetase
MIPVNTPLLDGNEKKYLIKCIEDGWISSEGPYVKQFEEVFAANVGHKYGVAVTNGTTALDIAIKALGIGPGDEVIIPTFTIISCASAVVLAGAKPIVVDCEALTWNMDVKKIEEKITKKTRAIMAVHIYGLTVDMNPLLALAKKYNLKVIEDTAQAHGLKYQDRNCGSMADIATFSFYPNKHITTGEGGMILTNSKELAGKCAFYRNLCFKPEQRFVHDELGTNARMTNIQAALGVAQMENLEKRLKRKREMGLMYRELLQGLKGVQLPLDKTEYCTNIYWVFGLVINIDNPLMAVDAMKKLAAESVGTRP